MNRYIREPYHSVYITNYFHPFNSAIPKQDRLRCYKVAEQVEAKKKYIQVKGR